ncbi:Oligoendopeptidase F [Alteracholeplasma palmae J233]|uniref:Oligopeptidase F n=1 Tax=Alteracholeplasma palmae (strain ATCC 49389 / J233) TaxID=1318466 RepID=U4KNQ8_ALTPJ|nr:oligoendopeptidase F [Alteracholeplasma palmae]CCV63840.1 Oligoendopeptidase F [Alteracholeplasma palmae J233]
MQKWDLTYFYPSDDAWEKDYEILESMINHFETFQGKLNEFDTFKAYHLYEEKFITLLYKVYPYAHLGSDLNLKDSVKGNQNQRVGLLLSKLGQKTSFVSPEIISLGEEKVISWAKNDDFLKAYVFPFEKLFRGQKHVLSELEEKILANYSSIRSIPTQLYQSLSIIDRTDEEVTLSNGKKVLVSAASYRALIEESENPSDRQLVFEALYKRYKDNKSAFANTYNLVLQQRAASYKSRNYASSLEAALDGNNIPVSVFHNLKDVVYENTDLIKRYINLRKKHLNLETYHTYDRFLKLAKSDKKYTYAESKELFFESIKHFTPEFVEKQKSAVADGFVDVLPQDGKRTGAYSSGFYGHHPFILLNHNETLDSAFTLAHEAGHSAHTLFSNEARPMAIADYTIFVAEIASTFNEHALLDYMLKNVTSKNERIVLLESAIDGILSTFYRQTLFATYEYEANKLVEEGKPINADALSKIMIDLYKHYYDLDIAKENGKELVWAYIPHLFHTPFYVYQYATSYSASLKIYSDIKNNKPHAMENYLGLLKSGGSDYPVNQAKKAGADLTTKDTFLAVITRFKELLDLLEETLKA